MTIAHPELDGLGNYEFGWSDKNDAGANSKRGINEEVVRDISAKKSEPQWMLDLRLKGLTLFEKKPMPNWGSDLSGIFFDTIKYFVRSTEKHRCCSAVRIRSCLSLDSRRSRSTRRNFP